MKLTGSPNDYLVAATEHSGPLQVYKLKRKTRILRITPADVSAIIQFKNGTIRKEEFYYGSSFLSQSSRFLTIGDDVTLIQITDSKGNTRRLAF
jgi:hypothetical protein